MKISFFQTHYCAVMVKNYVKIQFQNVKTFPENKTPLNTLYTYIVINCNCRCTCNLLCP